MEIFNGIRCIIKAGLVLFTSAIIYMSALARAILKNAPILILDEATSAMDPKTEAKVAGTLRTLLEGRTTISITHHLASKGDNDRILALENGKAREVTD